MYIIYNCIHIYRNDCEKILIKLKKDAFEEQSNIEDQLKAHENLLMEFSTANLEDEKTSRKKWQVNILYT